MRWLICMPAILAIVACAEQHGVATAGGEPPASPQFQTAPCPKTPEPMKALQHARCGYLIVPENRSKPGGRTIRLVVAIVPAASKPAKPDPIVFMAGGPG